MRLPRLAGASAGFVRPEIKFVWGLDMTQHEPKVQPLRPCKIVCVGTHQSSHNKLAVPFRTKPEDAEPQHSPHQGLGFEISRRVVESGGGSFMASAAFCRLHNTTQNRSIKLLCSFLFVVSLAVFWLRQGDLEPQQKQL